MLIPSGQFKIFLYPNPIDMRAGYDRLAYLCKEELGMNPFGGAIFLFFNRPRNRINIFFYDGTGSCVFCKRLERGRFKFPSIASGKAYGILPASELSLVLEGVDTSQITHPEGWQPTP